MTRCGLMLRGGAYRLGRGEGRGEIGRFDDYQTGTQPEISNALFNLSVPGITRLKRHQKQTGWLKTRRGDAHNILPYGFSSIRTEKSPKPAQWRKAGASPDRRLAYNPRAPLASARRKPRMQDHRTGRLGICSAARAAAPRSEGATQAAANAESPRI